MMGTENTDNPSVVILGSGLAGYTLARELRKLDRDTPLTMVTRDAGDFYSKPMLSNALSSGKAPAQMVTTRGAQMALQLGMTLRAHTGVLRVDAAGKRLETTNGTLRYSRLILALGADPVRLNLGGDGAQDVMSVNDLDDYARFRERIESAGHVAIMGAGLIGCEFANDLAASGRRVTVIDPAAYPLSALLPERAGRSLVGPLAAIGVNWIFGTGVTAVGRAVADGRPALLLELGDGSHIRADAVLSAVGLRPRIELAREAGLAVGRGIVVDDLLRTSVTSIYALGDCAEIGGRILPYVLPIMHGARALARTLAGTPTPIEFPPMPVTVKTPAWPVAVQPVARGVEECWQVLDAGEGVKMTFNDPNERLIGFALAGPRTAERVAMTRMLAA